MPPDAWRTRAVLLALVCAAATGAAGRTLVVGPGQALTTIAAAARAARDGDTVEVEAGDYVGDVAVWTQDELTLRARGGRVRLVAGGTAAEDKAIWVVRGGTVRIDGFEFSGARVAGRNGAGIRFERGRLEVRHCRFTDNEMGLLTSNDPQAELVVSASEFDHNQRPDGHNHNLYVGTIARVTVSESYFHHARNGHLLKSRAAVSRVLHNRLTDEAGGSASYELEFPNGGQAVVVGNIVAQGAGSGNAVIVAYGLEGYRWPANTLLLARNTLVDGMPAGGRWLRLAPGHGPVRALDNLLVGGSAGLDAGPGVEAVGNVRVDTDAVACAACGDVRLRPARAEALATAAADGGGAAPPSREYRHPLASVALPPSLRLLPGALQSVAAR